MPSPVRMYSAAMTPRSSQPTALCQSRTIERTKATTGIATPIMFPTFWALVTPRTLSIWVRSDHGHRRRHRDLHPAPDPRVPGAAAVALPAQQREQVAGSRPPRRGEGTGQAGWLATEAVHEVAEGRRQERIDGPRRALKAPALGGAARRKPESRCRGQRFPDSSTIWWKVP